MDTLRYDETKKSSKGPIIGLLLFFIISENELLTPTFNTPSFTIPAYSILSFTFIKQDTNKR